MDETNQIYESLQELKKEYMDSVRQINIEERQKASNPDDYVTLYHGTTTAYLNSILRNGLLPRIHTGLSNWERTMNSIDNVTYLTNKWHYFYAINAQMEYEGKQKTSIHQRTRTSFPCYIECRVPRDLLVIDEDFILTNYMLKKIKNSVKRKKDLEYDPMECLAEYGTVGVLGEIPPSMMISFTVLGEPKTIEYILDANSQYMKDWHKWQQGKGKGKIKLKQLWEKEAESNLNGTWWTHQLKKGYFVSFGINELTGKLAMIQSEKPSFSITNQEV